MFLIKLAVYADDRSWKVSLKCDFYRFEMMGGVCWDLGWRSLHISVGGLFYRDSFNKDVRWPLTPSH